MYKQTETTKNANRKQSDFFSHAQNIEIVSIRNSLHKSLWSIFNCQSQIIIHKANISGKYEIDDNVCQIKSKFKIYSNQHLHTHLELFDGMANSEYEFTFFLMKFHRETKYQFKVRDECT